MSSDSEQPLAKKQKKESDDAELTQRTLSTCNFTDQITVLVGPDEQPFLIHKDMICAKSKFFRAACSERWIEGKEEKVELPYVEASLFPCYLIWIYGGKLDVKRYTNEAIEALPSGGYKLAAKLVEMYILGDALDDVRLRNRVIQTLVLETKVLPNSKTIKRIWENILDGSHIGKMIVRRAVLRTERAPLANALKDYPANLVLQLAGSLLELVPQKDKKSFEQELPSYLELVEDVLD